MSHFTVLIVGDNPEEQLAPFQENNMEDCPKEYLVFKDMEKEYRPDFESGKKCKLEWYANSKVSLPQEFFDLVKESGGLIQEAYSPKDNGEHRFAANLKIGDRVRVSNYILTEDLNDSYVGEDEIYVEVAKFERPCKEDWVFNFYFKLIDPPKEIPLNTEYSDFETYIQEWHGCEEVDPETGKYGYWENPNCKWDWYVLGGRWSDFFKLKDGSRVDKAIKSDIDFEGTVEDSVKEAKANWEEAKKEDDIGMRYFHYGISKGDSEESYIKDCSEITTFAFLKDGEWYEKGEMGWFACVSNEKDPAQWSNDFNKMLSDLPEDTLLSLYDCHI